MRSSFSRSEASMRCTGMPVQRDTTSATSCASTSSLIIEPLAEVRRYSSCKASICFSASRILP